MDSDELTRLNKLGVKNGLAAGVGVILSLLALLFLAGCGEEPEDPIYANITAGSVNATLTGPVELKDFQSVVIRGSDNLTLFVDPVTQSLSVIRSSHIEIHEGHSYLLNDVTDLANGATRDLLLVTGNGSELAHFLGTVEVELEATVYFYEGTTYTDNGTALTPINRNRNSSDNATMFIYHTPTIGLTGDVIYQNQVGTGKKAGGEQRDVNEIILKRDTAYLVRVTNATVNNNSVLIQLNWYEH